MNKKEIKLLTQKWYKILEAQGFEDIETSKGTLKDAKRDLRQRERFQKQEAQEAFYKGQIQQGKEVKFHSKRHRRIFELYCEGIPYRGIAKALDLRSWSYVRRVVLKYAK